MPITDYESLTNLKTLRGRAVKIKNPKDCGIGGAWVEGVGDVNAGSFDIPVRGSTLIKSGIKDGIGICGIVFGKETAERIQCV